MDRNFTEPNVLIKSNVFAKSILQRLVVLITCLTMCACCLIASANPASAKASSKSAESDNYANLQNNTNVSLAKLYGTTDGVGLIKKQLSKIDYEDKSFAEGNLAFHLYYSMLMASNATRMASKTGKLDAPSEKLLKSVKEDLRGFYYGFALQITARAVDEARALEKQWKRIDAAKTPEQIKDAYKGLTDAVRFHIRNGFPGSQDVAKGMQNLHSNSFKDPAPTRSPFAGYKAYSLDSSNDEETNYDYFKPAPAPKTLKELNPNIKNTLTLMNNMGVEAGMPNAFYINTDKIFPNATQQQLQRVFSGSELVVYLYKGDAEKPSAVEAANTKDAKPKMLNHTNGNDFLCANFESETSKKAYFSVNLPNDCAGVYTLLITNEEGRQIAWAKLNIAKHGQSVGDVDAGAAIATGSKQAADVAAATTGASGAAAGSNRPNIAVIFAVVAVCVIVAAAGAGFALHMRRK